MPRVPRPVCRCLLLLALAPLALAATESAPEAYRHLNPDKLSGGAYAALEALGAFGRPNLPPAIARAGGGFADLSKGRAPAVLDPRVGPNVRLGDDPAPLIPLGQRNQAEPHVFRSATEPNLLLATFQEGRFAEGGGGVTCGYSISRDGGLTWTRALVPQLATVNGGAFLRATDPVAAIGPQGDLYLNNLTLGTPALGLGPAAITVSRSTDGGATWGAPVIVTQSLVAAVMPDKNWIAVNDFPAAPNSGRLVVTWTNFANNANNLLGAVSDDRGATWSAAITITPAGSNNQGTLPVFLPDGTLGVVYVTFIGSTLQFSINFKRSLDGGRTFPATATTVVPFVAAWDDPELRDGVFLPGAAVSRTTGEIFVTYTAVVEGSPRVLVTKSSDAGATWSAPVIASDNPAGASVMNPAIAASPDGRTLAAVFIDKRLAPEGRSFVDHFAALSFDGGATWQPNLRLTEMSSDVRLTTFVTGRGYMLGDYLGVAAANTADQPWVAAWCETRTGDGDPFATRFTAKPTATYDEWRIARFAPSEREVSREFSDFDGDGVDNALEFDAGTDPRRAESGEALVLTPRANQTTIVATTVRPNAGTFAFYSSRSLTLPSVTVSGGTQGSSAPAPAVPAGAGLVWQANSLSAYAEGTEFTRSVAFSAAAASPQARSRERATAFTDARLINLSTRGRVGAGGAQLIAGFVLAGNKSILVRAAGPALSALGVTGALADPRLNLQALASDIDLVNDNWQQGSSFLASAPLFARLGAFPFPANSLDAALTLPLGPQNYTALVSGTNNATGVALAEVYDADAVPGAPANPRLLNLSTRGDVGAGENALIAGFVLRGTQPRRVLIRAVGPSLTSFGVAGTLGDPVLTLFHGNTVVATNDDWEISRSGAAIAATAQRVGAFPLGAASLDAALLITLGPGNYTAVVTGVDGKTGIALVEVYDAD